MYEITYLLGLILTNQKQYIKTIIHNQETSKFQSENEILKTILHRLPIESRVDH